ncbi:MAG: tRNA 2-thiouridine(34) synthase MnmA [Acholeplasmataceae bacterium]|jgi:tRNA-specific 2-thiouridylase|nr:tRNA 2-thiouridine(34) synthase MnmA [Acholeplasmataceae bacterium]
MKKKVVLGLSGGVDSAVALIVLQQQGYDVSAVFMRNWDSYVNDDILGNPTLDAEVCSQEQDYQDAKSVADKLEIKLKRIDFIEEYWDFVFKYFLAEYEKGRTPNPDILCNTEIKFKAFLQYALTLDATKIAMGHYARVKLIDGEHVLMRAKDKTKDQTYFLSQLSSEQLSRAIFPVGDLTKEKVREIARKYQLDVAEKKDSTGICFIGERRFNEFLSNYILTKKGPIKTLDGTYLKDHEGLFYYTIGQRKGLGIGGLKDYQQEPWFVVGKDLLTNTLYVAQGFHHHYLYSNSCTVKDVVFRGNRNLENREFTALFRYRQQDNEVKLKWLDETTLLVSYPQKVRAVTPGQAAAFYEGEICVGGGFIDQVYFDNQKRMY